MRDRVNGRHGDRANRPLAPSPFAPSPPRSSPKLIVPKFTSHYDKFLIRLGVLIVRTPYNILNMNEPTPQQVETATAVLTIIPMTMRYVAAELRQHDPPIVPPQLMVLNLLFQEGSKNLTQLAEMSAVSLPTMSGTVKTLVNDGYVERIRSQEDRRVTLLEITPDGRALLEAIGQKIVARVAQLLHDFDQEELAQIQEGFSIFQRAVSLTSMQETRK